MKLGTVRSPICLTSAYRLHCLHQKDRIQTPKASRRKSLTLQAIGYDGDHIYRLLTNDNRVIRSTNVEFVERGLFEHTYSDHFHTPQLEPSRADDTLDPLRALSKARQLEESTCSHTPAPGGRYLRSISMTAFLSLNCQQPLQQGTQSYPIQIILPDQNPDRAEYASPPKPPKDKHRAKGEVTLENSLGKHWS